MKLTGSENWIMEDEAKTKEQLVNDLMNLRRRIAELEKSLRLSKKNFYSICNTAVDAILVMDGEGKISFWNPAAEKMFGYTGEEAIGKDLHLLLAPERFHADYVKGFSVFRKTGQGPAVGNTLEFIALRKNGSEFPIEVSTSAYQIEGQWLTVGIVRDVTERKRMENLLRNISEKVSAKTGDEYFRSVAEFAATELGIEYAFVGELVKGNRKVKTVALYAHGKFLDNIEYDLDNAPCKTVIGGKAAFYPGKISELFPDSQFLKNLRAESYVGVPLFSSGGKPLGHLAILGTKPLKKSDELQIMGLLQFFAVRAAAELDRRRAEDELQESEHRFREITDTAIDTIITIDSSGAIVLCNRAVERQFGYTVDQLVGRDVKIIIPRRYRKDHENGIKRFLATGAVHHIGQTRELYALKKDGTEFPIELSLSTWKTGKYTFFTGIVRDITERKKLEAQLLQAQKMEAVGQLAGGIAHDFNNILTALIGYCHVLKMKLREDDPLRSYADHILSLSDKAANLTRGLLAFSRKQIFNLRPLNLNKIVRNMEKIFLRVIGEDIELKITLEDKIITVMADPGQIEQVLMNLVTNARDAMPAGGMLAIETELADIDNEFIKEHGYGTEGKYVLLSVTDTGQGIDKKTSERIFEPFFTTKEVGRGTGLGLSVVYGIVKQHNGFINVYSEVGNGTSFKIYLPVIKAEAEEITPDIASSLERGTETVLLAEDDMEVRVFTKKMLEEFGYEVVEAKDGEDAVHKFLKNKDKIQLLLLDVIMPRKSGKDAYEEIRKLRPDIKVLFMSGYTADIIHGRRIIEEGLEFIVKPVSPIALLKRIRETLEK